MNLKEKYELVCQVLSGQGLRTVAIVAGINSGQLYQWVHKYKTLGYNGLIWVHIKVIKMKKLFLNLEVIDGYPPVSMESILKIVHCGLFSLMKIRNLKIKY